MYVLLWHILLTFYFVFIINANDTNTEITQIMQTLQIINKIMQTVNEIKAFALKDINTFLEYIYVLYTLCFVTILRFVS